MISFIQVAIHPSNTQNNDNFSLCIILSAMLVSLYARDISVCALEIYSYGKTDHFRIEIEKISLLINNTLSGFCGNFSCNMKML